MFSKILLYHFKYAMERPDLVVWALAILAGAVVICTPIWVTLSTMTSKKRCLTTGMGTAFVGYISMSLAPATDPSITFAAITLVGVGVSALPVMFWSMLTDTIEYGQVATGERAEARTIGFAAFTQKAAIGVNAMLVGALLSWAGFVANEPQTPETLSALRALMALVPAAGAFAILLILRGYRLDKAAHDALLQKLARSKD